MYNATDLVIRSILKTMPHNRRTIPNIRIIIIVVPTVTFVEDVNRMRIIVIIGDLLITTDVEDIASSSISATAVSSA